MTMITVDAKAFMYDDNDPIDKWVKDELERARIEFADKLEVIIEQFAKKKYGKLGESFSRHIVVNISLDMK